MAFAPGGVPAPTDVDWFRDRGEAPTIVSLSDVHAYLDAARSALTAVGETDTYPPVVTTDADGRLHWADNDYLLVVNGDLIDRGPDNDACFALVERLMDEAPPGRVRYHLGNHEMAVMFPDLFHWPGVYSVELASETRRKFLEAVAAGAVPVAFAGYRYVYSHAGANDAFDVATVNDQVQAAASELLEAFDGGLPQDVQEAVADRYPTVFGLGGVSGRGPDAGLLWMDFKHMTSEAPAQIVGHSRQREPTRTGNVVCANLIRANLGAPGGEGVLLETPAGLEAILRTATGTRTTRP